MTKRLFGLVGCGLIAAIFAACNVEPESYDVDDDEGGDTEEVTTVTEVDLEQGGKVISTRLVSHADRAAAASRARELAEDGLGQTSDAITEDTDCVPANPFIPLLKIYDQTSYGGNKICFYGSGQADLNDYCRTYGIVNGFLICTDKWDYNVRSFTTGSVGAGFRNHNSDCCDASQVYPANTSYSSTGSCEQDSRYVERTSSQNCVQ